MKRAPRGSGTIFRESDPRRKTTWVGEKRVTLPNGKKKRITVRGMTQREVMDKLRQRERALAKAHPTAERLTLGRFIDDWLEHRKLELKANSIASYEQGLRHVKAELGDLTLAQLKPEHVRDLLRRILAGQVTLSEPNRGFFTTANNARRYLSSVMREAVRLELVTANPVENVKPVTRPPVKRGKWEKDEVRRFLEVTEGSLHHALFFTAVFTGLRKGELMALRWESVTPSAIHVVTTYARHAEGRQNAPKTAKGERTVPISRRVYEVIEAQTDGELAFPGENGMLSASAINKAMRRYILKAGVTPIRFHDLRRCAATYWAEAGFTPKMIQTLLGHSTVKLALEVYTDVLESQMEKAMLEPADFLSGGLSGGLTAEQNGENDTPRDSGEKGE